MASKDALRATKHIAGDARSASRKSFPILFVVGLLVVVRVLVCQGFSIVQIKIKGL